MATTPTPAVDSPPPATSTPEPTPTTRLAYTRHATVGDNDDRIVNLAWYNFLKVMLVIGGIATLLGILFGGFQWGRATAVPVLSPSVVTPVVPPPAPVVAPVVVPPPKVEIINRIEVVAPPSPPAPVVREQTDAERRNEMLKERLRSRYHLQ